MSKHEPIYMSEFAELAGLDENRWDIAIDKQYAKAKATGDTHTASVTLYRAWVQHAIHDPDTNSLYSVGMHLLGHRDVDLKDDHDVSEAVKWIDLMGLYLVADKPKRSLRGGEGFRLSDRGPRRIIELDDCLRYSEDDFFFNPYGYIRLADEDT